MKALSVRNPWAWALVTDILGSPVGNKCVENRGWKTAYRGDLLIVSSQKPANHAGAVATLIEKHTGYRPELGLDRYMALGAILGVVKMIACLDIDAYERCLGYAKVHSVSTTTVIEAVDQGALKVGMYDRLNDWWASGPYCHVYTNVRTLPPTKTSGRLGLYDLKTVHGVPIETWIQREAKHVR